MVSAYIKDNIPYDKSYTMKIDRILEKPVYLDRLKNRNTAIAHYRYKEKYILVKQLDFSLLF